MAIPEVHRDHYRRIVSRYGADALSACEEGSCTGCYTVIPPQMINELMNNESLQFCMSCGRLLYLSQPEVPVTTRRKAKAK